MTLYSLFGASREPLPSYQTSQQTNRVYTANIVGSLGERFHLRIDPTWFAQVGGGDDAWNSPMGRRLDVMFYDLEEGLEESAGVNYADSEIIGRAEGYKSYVGTANKEIPLAFKFQAQGGLGENLPSTLQQEVVDPARWLEALKYPYQSPSGVSFAPPRVLLFIGRLLRARCVATDVSIRWQAPFDPDTMLPYAAEVLCTFAVVREKITNYPFRDPRWT